MDSRIGHAGVEVNDCVEIELLFGLPVQEVNGICLYQAPGCIGRSTIAHFSDTSEYAQAAAKGLLSGIRKTQFSPMMAIELALRTRYAEDTRWPVIVMALDTPYNQTDLPASRQGSEPGFVYSQSFLTLDMVDPYSRAFIDNLLPKKD